MSSTMAASADSWSTMGGGGEIRVEHWPSESRLFALSVVVSILAWLILTVSVVGILYAAVLAIFFFVMHVVFVSHIRGNGVRLGPDQFPELHGRVEEIARRMGMERIPAIYMIQAGGSLNALATRFLRSYMVILFTDLLEACGEDDAARDMIIGHELGHIRAGHLRWHWFLLPASLFPFLGAALSRAREYTCDRYGFASTDDREGALLGLTILAAGGMHGRRVNRHALVRQRQDLNTGWMTIGKWLSTHPPLANRLVALEPSLATGQPISAAGSIRALAIVFMGFLPLVVAGWVGFRYVSGIVETVAEEARGEQTAYVTAPTDEAMEQLQASIDAVSAFLTGEIEQGRELPGDYNELAERWAVANPDRPIPVDPFDGLGLGYFVTPTGYVLWSSGPDRTPDTDDDIDYPFRRQQQP